MLCVSLSVITFVSGCAKPSDCPNGGTNFQCIANLCECPFPMVLDDDNCVGMSPFYKDNFTQVKFTNSYSDCHDCFPLIGSTKYFYFRMRITF